MREHRRSSKALSASKQKNFGCSGSGIAKVFVCNANLMLRCHGDRSKAGICALVGYANIKNLLLSVRASHSTCGNRDDPIFLVRETDVYLRFLLAKAIAAAAPASIATEYISLPVAGFFSGAASTEEESLPVFTVSVSVSSNRAP